MANGKGDMTNGEGQMIDGKPKRAKEETRWAIRDALIATARPEMLGPRVSTCEALENVRNQANAVSAQTVVPTEAKPKATVPEQSKQTQLSGLRPLSWDEAEARLFASGTVKHPAPASMRVDTE
jgi:hypothetical protein